MLCTIGGENETLHDVVDRIIYKKLMILESRRYLYRNRNRKRPVDKYAIDQDSGNLRQNPHLNDREFRVRYHMSRAQFSKLLKLIENRPVFSPKRKVGRKQTTVSDQLMTFLSVIGGIGSSGANTRHKFSIGYGTHYSYCDRVTEAICSQRDQVFFLPDEEERCLISSRMKVRFDFSCCVGMGDGTLFPLKYQPTIEDAPDYSGRKHHYSLTCFIINDNKRRIQSYIAG